MEETVHQSPESAAFSATAIQTQSGNAPFVIQLPPQPASPWQPVALIAAALVSFGGGLWVQRRTYRRESSKQRDAAYAKFGTAAVRFLSLSAHRWRLLVLVKQLHDMKEGPDGDKHRSEFDRIEERTIEVNEQWGESKAALAEAMFQLAICLESRTDREELQRKCDDLRNVAQPALDDNGDPMPVSIWDSDESKRRTQNAITDWVLSKLKAR